VAADGPQPGAGEAAKPRRRGRLKRLGLQAKTLWNDPRSAGDLAREGLIGIWRARGGGFYGLGYLVTFVILEVRMLIGEFQESTSVAGFLTTQLLEYVLRVGLLSLVNALQAFLWPLLTIAAVGAWAIPVLAGGYFAFERWLRPLVEAEFPELQRPARPRDAARRGAGRGR
jgi:hypothetical protein